MYTKSKSLMKRLLIVGTFAVIVVLIFTALPYRYIKAAAEIDISDNAIKKLEDRMANIESEQKALKAKIAKAEKGITDQKAYKADLDKQLQLKQEDIEVKASLIIEYQNKIRDTEVSIASLEESVTDNYELFKKRMCMSYEEGNLNYLEIVLGAENFSDFIMSIERVGSMLDYEQNMMENLNDTAAKLKLIKDKQLIDKANAEKIKADLEVEEKDIKQKAQAAVAYIDTLSNDKIISEKAMRQNVADLAAIDSDIEKILLERQKQKEAAYVGGDLRWPLDAKFNVITSGYGYRDFDKAVHTGLDIRTNYGEAVYAANAGVVVTATYHSSYGYYVLIDHGGGLATLYAHNSSLLVSAGDEVTMGQQIAKAGSTGYSTGNHCHFEVRVNGKTVDPLAKPYVYVPASN